jgi:hypothetical protein
VCAQPFNNNILLGLYFIKLISPEENKIDANINGHPSSHFSRWWEKEVMSFKGTNENRVLAFG